MYYGKSNLLGVVDRFKMIPKQVIEKGNCKLMCYEYKERNDILYNLRAARDGHAFMTMYEGTYVKLIIDGKLFMSDTNMEKLTNSDFIQKANGKVLIAGLGIGLLLENLMKKLKSKEITEIVVVENNKNVIDIVAPFFKDKKIKIIEGDIFNFKTGDKFDSIYFDIWESINQDNYKEMKELHKKFKYNLNRENSLCYMNSWMKEYLQKEIQREKRESLSYSRYRW